MEAHYSYVHTPNWDIVKIKLLRFLEKPGRTDNLSVKKRIPIIFYIKLRWKEEGKKCIKSDWVKTFGKFFLRLSLGILTSPKNKFEGSGGKIVTWGFFVSRLTVRTRHGWGPGIIQDSRSRKLYARSHSMTEGMRRGSVGECGWIKKKKKKKEKKKTHKVTLL